MAEEEKTQGGMAEQETEAAPALEEAEFVEDPQFQVDYKGDCVYEVGVTIPVANEQHKAQEMIDELTSEVELPGFRRGKAPRKLVEKRFSKAVRGEVESKLVAAAFRKLLRDEKLHPVAMPDVEGLEEEKDRPVDQPLSFTFKFEVVPRVELGSYRGVEVEKPVLKVGDEEIESAIEELRGRYASFETIEDGKAQEGDQVYIDFNGTIEGEAFQGGSAENYPYILGTKRFFPEFEDVLEGSAPGDELTCEVNFPEDYFEESLRGKKADFTIKVNELKRRVVPELTDDFAKQAGYESVEDLREKVSNQIREGAKEESERLAEQHAMDQVMESSTYEIPETLIKRSAEDIVRDRIGRLMQMRVPRNMIEERLGELEESAREEAVSGIKRVVALNEIAEAEGLDVTEEDFEQELESVAQRAGVDASVVGDYVNEDEQRRSEYEERVLRAKALKVIMDNATITEKEVTREELEKANAEAENAESAEE